MKKIYFKHKDELYSNKKYLLFSFIISIYVFLPQIFIYKYINDILAIIVSFIVLFLLSKVNKIIFILVSFFTLLTNSVVLHIAIHWGNAAVVPRIQAALLSPDHEISDYLNTYLDYTDVLISLYFIVGIYLIYKLLTTCRHSYKIIKITSLSLLLIIILMLASIQKITNLLPYKYIDRMAAANEWKAIVDKRTEYLKKQNHKTVEGNLLYDKIVIIMGESANKHHMGAYNYHINTTPFLSKLLKSDNCFKFDNIIAPSNQTRYAVSLGFTDATVEHFYNYTTSESIITNFKNYGYKTYWLSSQYASGEHDTYISSIAKESDYTYFTNFVFDADVNPKYDMNLLNLFDKIKMEPDSKELFVFHLLGSHFQYDRRYPKSEGLFDNPKNVIEKYDNSIFYTDSVISKIHDKFKGTKFLFIYLSDHSEVVNLKQSGHGFFPTYKEEYDVPFVIYSSLNNQNILDLKQENEISLFNLEGFNNIVKYIVGMENNFSKISHNPNVMPIDPINIVNYQNLNTFENELKNKNK